MAVEAKRDRSRSLIWMLLAAAATCTLAYALYIVADEPPVFATVAELWVYHGALVLASLTCFARGAVVRGQRAAWFAFGLGLLFWAAGDLYWTLALADVKDAPYPSGADVGYLATLPCFYVGIALLIKRRVGHFTITSWLDGAIGALAAASLATALLAPALVNVTKGDPTAVLTNLAYPLGDILLIGFIVGALVVSGWRGAGEFLALIAGLIVWTLGDAVYLYQEATIGYQGGWLDESWLLGALLIAGAVAVSFTHRSQRRRIYSSGMLFPTLFGAIAVGVLTWDHFSRVHEVSIWLSAATLAAVIIRLGLSFRENTALMEALHDDAATDSLTELGNRRKLLVDLESALGAARGVQHVFVLYDLDGFKLYNDNYGHPAGDSLLRRLGANLAAAVAPQGRAYRLGGDEFCILLPSPGADTDAIVEVGRAALSEQGEGFRVTASAGALTIPDEGGAASEALRLADRRLYADKSVRSGRLERQTQEFLLTMLREREPELSDHHEDVSRLSVALGREVGFDAEEIDVLRRAAELHDIGKIAIPEETLRKPAPLDEMEWELMRKHTLIGERIIGTFPSMAPVARLVRSSHERWDGKGYPDGLAGEEIPVGARIICLCDAFDAMRSERPYGAIRQRESALAEIRRMAGTQFDPNLIDVFSRIVGDVERADARRGEGASASGERRLWRARASSAMP